MSTIGNHSTITIGKSVINMSKNRIGKKPCVRFYKSRNFEEILATKKEGNETLRPGQNNAYYVRPIPTKKASPYSNEKAGKQLLYCLNFLNNCSEKVVYKIQLNFINDFSFFQIEIFEQTRGDYMKVTI